MKNYLKILAFLHGHRTLFATAVIAMLLANIFEVFSMSVFIPLIDIVFTGRQIASPSILLPDFVDRFIDYLNNMDRNRLLQIALPVALILTILKNALGFCYQYWMSDLSQQVMKDIRSRLYTKILNLSLGYFSSKRTGELVSRITFDANLIENAVSYGLTDLFRQTFFVIIWVTSAISFDPKASFVIFVIFPLLGYPMSRIGIRLRKISQGVQEQMADINSLLLETISGIKVVKAFRMEDYERDRFDQQNHMFYKLKIKSIKRIVILSPMTEIFGGFCVVGLFYWFSQRVLSGELSLGVFSFYILSVMSVIRPIKKLGNVNALLQQALSANERIYDILQAEVTVKEPEKPKPLSELQSKIEIKDVSFRYDKVGDDVLKNVSLTINKGELVAIVGPTGSGKSTLLNLIPRFYDATSGQVSFDGVDVKDVSFSDLRGQIGIVTQESILFNASVRENISYGHSDIPNEKIYEAARQAYAERFIQKMPKQYDTVIGDRGFRLSGGERQRISIARAILKNPPVLLLDEATSQLDSESERFVQDAIDQLMKGRTVVAVAHRLSTIQKADKIVVVEQGQIVGVGPHQELIKNCELYKKLHDMQFQA